MTQRHLRTDSSKAYGLGPFRLDFVYIDELGEDGTGVVDDLGRISLMFFRGKSVHSVWLLARAWRGPGFARDADDLQKKWFDFNRESRLTNIFTPDFCP